MVDPLSVAIGTAASVAVSAGCHIHHAKKQKELERQQRRLRIELYCVEGAVGVGAITFAIDSILWKRSVKARAQQDALDIDNLNKRLDALTDRVNELNIGDVKQVMYEQNETLKKILDATEKKESK